MKNDPSAENNAHLIQKCITVMNDSPTVLGIYTLHILGIYTISDLKCFQILQIH